MNEYARHEIKEKTGLDAEIGEHLITFERIVKEREPFLHVIYVDYWAKVTGDDRLRPGDDIGEARWVEPSGLRDILE